MRGASGYAFEYRASGAGDKYVKTIDPGTRSASTWPEIRYRHHRLRTGKAHGRISGWIVEAEMVELQRIPSSADMLALYEIELDADGELLACARTRRYMRGQNLSIRDSEPSAIGNANSVEAG